MGAGGLDGDSLAKGMHAGWNDTLMGQNKIAQGYGSPVEK